MRSAGHPRDDLAARSRQLRLQRRHRNPRLPRGQGRPRRRSARVRFLRSHAGTSQDHRRSALQGMGPAPLGRHRRYEEHQLQGLIQRSSRRRIRSIRYLQSHPRGICGTRREERRGPSARSGRRALHIPRRQGSARHREQDQVRRCGLQVRVDRIQQARHRYHRRTASLRCISASGSWKGQRRRL